jgi:hypothetical protein
MVCGETVVERRRIFEQNGTEEGRCEGIYTFWELF